VGLTGFGFSGLQMNKIGTNMIDEIQIARTWVEIREDSIDDRLVFRPSDYPIPPARGRRQLELSRSGQGQALDAGASDKLETVGLGEWKIDGQTLILNIRGWEGAYEIEDLQADILILQKH